MVFSCIKRASYGTSQTDKLEVVLGGVKRSYILFRVNKFLQKKLHIPFLSMPLHDKLNSKRFC